VTSTNGTNGAKRIGKIADLKPDSKNANLGTQRGRGLLEKSLRQYGAGRSVLVDRDGNLIAGNKTVDVAAEIDLPVRVVQTDGNELVVVQRTDLDLDSSEGRGLAIADNRTGETGLEWDQEVLNGLSETLDLTAFWRYRELQDIGVDVKFEDVDIDYDEAWRDMPEFGNEPQAAQTIRVHFKTAEDVKRFGDLVGQSITEKTRYLWWPEKKRIKDNMSFK